MSVLTPLDLETCFNVIRQQVHDDHDYAWGFHSNLAVPMMDACMIDHRQANVSAALIMAQLFGVDMTRNKNWPAGYLKSRAQRYYETRVEAELLLTDEVEHDDTKQAY